MTEILVLQVVGNLDDIGLSVYNNSLFANYQGYDILCRHHKASDYACAWDKVLFLMDELVRKSYEYIYVLSNNSSISNIRTGIDSLLSIGAKDVLMYKNKDSSICTNNFLVRNTTQAETFFRTVLNYVDDEAPNLKTFPSWDAEVITYLYPQWDSVIGIQPEFLFNLK